MKQAIKDLWVAALRSGEFTQGRGKLRSADGHCCLGVLCELALKAEVVEHYNAWDSHPPQSVLDWAGLATEGGKFPAEHGPSYLTNRNDGGVDFDKIADLIEQHWEAL